MDRINLRLTLSVQSLDYLKKIKDAIKQPVNYSQLMDLIIIDYIKNNKLFCADKIEKNKVTLFELEFPKESNYKYMPIRAFIARKKSKCFLCESIIEKETECFYNVRNNILLCCECKKIYIDK